MKSPPTPKFKAGDWVKNKNGGKGSQIMRVTVEHISENECAHCGHIEPCDEWTIKYSFGTGYLTEDYVVAA